MSDNDNPQGNPPVAPGADTGSNGPLGDVVPRARLNQEIQKRRELEDKLAQATAAAQNPGNYWDDAPVVDNIAPLQAQVEKQGQQLEAIVPGIQAMVLESQTRANQEKARVELKAFFVQKEGEGFELTDAYRAAMQETYVNEIAAGNLFGYVPLEEVENLVVGRLTKKQMRADAVTREAAEADGTAPPQDPAAAAGAGSTVVVAQPDPAASGEEDPFKGLDPRENKNWQADFMARFGDSDFEPGNTKGIPVQED